jgi:hypothetical protein
LYGLWAAPIEVCAGDRLLAYRGSHQTLFRADYTGAVRSGHR